MDGSLKLSKNLRSVAGEHLQSMNVHSEQHVRVVVPNQSSQLHMR